MIFIYLGLSRDDDVESLAVDELSRLLGGVAERAPGVTPVGEEPPLVLAALRLEHRTAPGRKERQKILDISCYKPAISIQTELFGNILQRPAKKCANLTKQDPGFADVL